MDISQLHQLFLKYPSICTDTRKLQNNAIFFALKGDNFNGNKFAKNAIEQGAKYAVVDDPDIVIDSRYVLVDNVLESLQKLANYHRKYLNTKIIALTGSNGKTTTKELIHEVLKQTYRTVATKGNLNNHIGVPLTLLTMDESTEIGIIEMGANHLKEIEFLCGIAEPNYGYITNFGKAHLEGFGSLEGVIKGKTELYKYLIAHNGTIFYNGDDHIQKEHCKIHNHLVRFGSTDDSSIKIQLIHANPFVRVNYKETILKSNLIGTYNFSNISAAIAIADYFKVPLEIIKNAIESYSSDNNRSQIIQKGSIQIILDAYNANPSSMMAALDNFSKMKVGHKIACLGDMFELGKDASMEHKAIAAYASKLNMDSILLVGQNFYQNQIKSEKIAYFESFETLKSYFEINPLEKSTLLIKASRGMALERLLEVIK